MPTTVATLTYNRLPEIARRLPGLAREVCLKTALEAEAVVKTGMAEGKTGAWYGDHQASAPGEMPAVDTGALVNSITTESDGTGAVVYTNMEYAAKLEYGSPVEHLEPRPFFGPAAEAVRADFVAAMQDLERRL